MEEEGSFAAVEHVETNEIDKKAQNDENEYYDDSSDNE